MADDFLIVIGDRLAGAAALEEAIVALRIKEAVFIEAGFLEAVIDVGGEDEICLLYTSDAADD